MTKKRVLLGWIGVLLLAACRGPQQQQSTSSQNQPSQPPSTAAPPAAPVNEAPPATASAPVVASAAPDSGERSMNFDDDRPGAPPAGFTFGRTGSGAPGRWIVRPESDAASKPNVLAQIDADDTSNRFPLAVLEAPSSRDVRMSVKCKLVSGKVDQACGMVFRYRDENNYFITRANALENNVRLYTIKDGKRRQIASFDGPVEAGRWHDYAVEVEGDRIQIFWNGKQVLDHRDTTFSDAGRVGLWTKADSVTYFDDLAVAPR